MGFVIQGGRLNICSPLLSSSIPVMMKTVITDDKKETETIAGGTL